MAGQPALFAAGAAAQSVFSDTDWSHDVMPWPAPVLRALLAPTDPKSW